MGSADRIHRRQRSAGAENRRVIGSIRVRRKCASKRSITGNGRQEGAAHAERSRSRHGRHIDIDVDVVSKIVGELGSRIGRRRLHIGDVGSTQTCIREGRIRVEGQVNRQCESWSDS